MGTELLINIDNSLLINVDQPSVNVESTLNWFVCPPDDMCLTYRRKRAESTAARSSAALDFGGCCRLMVLQYYLEIEFCWVWATGAGSLEPVNRNQNAWWCLNTIAILASGARDKGICCIALPTTPQPAPLLPQLPRDKHWLYYLLQWPIHCHGYYRLNVVCLWMLNSKRKA